MLANYDLDHLPQYGVEAINPDKQVVNPDHRNLSARIKKENEKLSRLKANLLKEVELSSDQSLDQFGQSLKNQQKLTEQIQVKQNLGKDLLEKRKAISYKIKLSQMPEQKRYTKLKTESQILTNAVKMVCYRAETALANLLEKTFNKAKYERRMLIKQIIQSPADLEPNFTENTLTITLHSLSAPRFNQALENLLDTLNLSNTLFPETNLKMIFKII